MFVPSQKMPCVISAASAAISHKQKQGDKLRILHIWNTAGVASVIAKFMDSLYPTESWVVMRKSFDKFGFTIIGDTWDCGAWRFCLKALLKARKYHVLHLHGLDNLIPFIRTVYGMKPIILHYHGTDIRFRWEERKHLWIKANKVFVATEDLLKVDESGHNECNFHLLPTIVDTELFFEDKSVKPMPNSALYVNYGERDLAQRYARDNDLALTILDRERTPIPHTKMREYLSKYEYFIDYKRVGTFQGYALSKNALEALACGCKVVSRSGSIVAGLPEDHRPPSVVNRIWQAYKELGILE